MKKTARGFNIYGECKDSKGSTITIQESSSTQRAVWIFCENPNPNYLNSEPHLTPAQAKRIVKYLNKFIEES